MSKPSNSKKKGKKSKKAEEPVLDPAALPPFTPLGQIVQCSNGPMSALMWAFSCNVSPLARLAMVKPGLMDTTASPAIHWNYSLFHMAHHYESSSARNFLLQYEEGANALLIEVTALKACPGDDKLGALSSEEFLNPEDMEEKLGPIPLFFARFFYLSPHSPNPPPADVIQSTRKQVMKVEASTAKEVEYAHKEL